MSRKPIHTAYCRYDGQFPSSGNMDSAVIGLNDLGIKIVPFYSLEDINNINCGPEALVVGYISDVKMALKKLGLPMPPDLDYPIELQEFYGRKIWKSTMGEVRSQYNGPVFIKPTVQKLFNGLVWTASQKNRITLARVDDNVPVFMSDVVE